MDHILSAHWKAVGLEPVKMMEQLEGLEGLDISIVLKFYKLFDFRI